MKRAEIICALAVLAWAGLMLREATRLNIGWESSGPGAGFFPFWLSAGLAIFAVVVLIQTLRAASSAPKKRFIPAGALPSLLKVVLPIAGMILAMEIAGFYLAAALYLAFVMRWIGRHPWPLVIGVSFLFPLATYFVIERWFLVLLPKGYLEIRLPF
ncbi:MAG: tripartite tricarboxylate transporter TctB family protein [Candidatus Rokubacteria bacterium]|nr:tripartite tricarboxylate transporter TctB family protein [Candidatus Rokubacteria bacterium]